ncbi:hypothetical protein HDU93_006435, partial [Gonapodya sp. JEL0774]
MESKIETKTSKSKRKREESAASGLGHAVLQSGRPGDRKNVNMISSTTKKARTNKDPTKRLQRDQ